MADYDRRGGGGGGGGYNRKRRYRDDDNDYRQQRRRHDVPVPVRIRRQLLSLAESPLRRWHDDAVSLARLVADNDDDAHVRESFVNLSCQLVREQPLKTPFVASVLLVVNALKPSIVLEVLRKVAGITEQSIAAGDWRDVKLCLRLLACLQTCLEGDGVFPILDTLFARAVDLQTASSDDVVGTELVKIILLTIPYIMAAAPGQDWQQRAADLMEKTEIIASEPHALQGLMDPYHHNIEVGNNAKDEDDDVPVPVESLLCLLQKQLQAEAADSWPLACLPRPWKLPLEDVELQAKLDEPNKHPLPAVAVPETVVSGPRPLFPEMYFSVYGAGDTSGNNETPQSVPPVTNVASSLIRDSLLDTVNVLDFNRNVTARFLIDVDCYFADDTFVKRATPFDRLRDVEPGRPTWKPEDVVVDTVFSQLFQLPAAEHKLVYYHSLLAEACKIAPAAIAPSLGRAIRFLYRNSHRMDLELVIRFVDWFSHHLSNFGFTWKWAEWVDDVALPDMDPHKAFIIGAIDKEIRLSFAQRIKNTLPEPYQSLITPEMEQDVPTFKFHDESTPFAAEGQALATLLRRKSPDEEIQAVIEKLHSNALDTGRVPLVESTDAFTTAVLWVGSKSLSHVLACIERTKDRLLDSGAASEAARQQILTAVMTFWASHPGVALCIVEKLLNYAILSPAVVVQWALPAPSAASEDGGSSPLSAKGKSLSQTYVAEMVFSTVAKVTRRVHQLVSTSHTAVDAVAAAKKAVEAAKERQKNPPPPPPQAAPVKTDGAAAKTDDAMLDVDTDEQQQQQQQQAQTGAEVVDAVAAAVAEAAAAVEAAETAVVTATEELDHARAAEAAEIRAMRDLFRQVTAALRPWSSLEGAGAEDGEEDTDMDGEQRELTKAWAVRWQRAVERQAAVEELFLADAKKTAEKKEAGLVEAVGQGNGSLNGSA